MTERIVINEDAELKIEQFLSCVDTSQKQLHVACVCYRGQLYYMRKNTHGRSTRFSITTVFCEAYWFQSKREALHAQNVGKRILGGIHRITATRDRSQREHLQRMLQLYRTSH